MSPDEQISLKEFFTSQLNNLDRRIVSLEERTAKHSSSFNLKDDALKLGNQFYGLDESMKELESRLQKMEDEKEYDKRIQKYILGILAVIIATWLKGVLGL